LHLQIASSFLEVAIYEDLKTLNPSFAYFFADLVSQVSSSSGPTNFNSLWAPKVFDLAFNSQLTWQLAGGTNYWRDINEKYTTEHTFSALSEGAEQNALEIVESAQEQGHFLYTVSCKMPGYYGKSKQHKFEVTTS